MSGIQTLVAAATPARPPSRPNRLLRAGVVVGPLFVLVFLVEEAFRGGGYDPMRHPVSSLELGPGGWVQVLNFLAAGVLCLAFAAGLRRALRGGPGGVAGPVLLAVWGAGLLGAGVFRTDPVSGYPAGTPAVPDPPSWHGQLHDLAFSLPGFVSLAAAMVVLASAYARRRRPGWAACSGVSAVAFVALFVLTNLGFGQNPHFVGAAGMWQRLTVGVGWLWMALVAVHELAQDRRMRAPARP